MALPYTSEVMVSSDGSLPPLERGAIQPRSGGATAGRTSIRGPAPRRAPPRPPAPLCPALVDSPSPSRG